MGKRMEGEKWCRKKRKQRTDLRKKKHKKGGGGNRERRAVGRSLSIPFEQGCG